MYGSMYVAVKKVSKICTEGGIIKLLNMLQRVRAISNLGMGQKRRHWFLGPAGLN